MVEKGASNSAGTVHPLIKKLLASNPAIAELIGFSVEEISVDALWGRWSPGRNTRIRWAPFMAAFRTIWRMQPGHGVRVHIGVR